MAARTILTDVKIRQVALLHSQDHRQKEIMDLVGLSQTSVSRAIRLAREAHYLEDQPRCTLPPDQIAELEHLLYAPELLDALQRLQPAGCEHLRRLKIFHAGRLPRSPSMAQLEGYRDGFGQLVAEHLLDEVFPHVQSMGVTWGSTLLAVVRGIAQRRAARVPPGHTIEFLPVCGAPPDAIEAALRSSSNLVAALDQHINGTNTNPNNYTGVCAAISSRFSAAETRVLRKYFRENRGYCRVFGQQPGPGRIDTMDAVITSIGTAVATENPWIAGAADAAGVEPAVLARSVIGNVAGVFLARPGSDAARLRMIERVNSRWTGIQLRQFLSCSERAVSRKRGGTILVAFGHRAAVTMACVRAGLVAELLVDVELATDLLRELGLHGPIG